MGALALLSSLSDLFAQGGQAKEQLRADDIAKQLRDQQARQAYSQLQTAALQRDEARQRMRLAEHPADTLTPQLAAMERAMGRPLTSLEKERALGIAAKEYTPKVITKLEQDANSSTGWSYVSYDQLTGQEYSRQLDAPPQRGLIESETRTTDPLTGLTTVSRRKPILGGGGAKTAPKGATPLPAAASTNPLSALFPSVIPAPAKKSSAGPLAKRGATTLSSTPAGLPPLDENGHIPASYKDAPAAVVETANELLDGKDQDKVKYAKLVPVASALARRYGWEQGKFTPKEQVMLRETTSFLQRAMRDGSMRVLDEGTVSRLKLAQLIQNPDREGFIGRGAQAVLAQGMSPSQVRFIQTYNQLVGTISGLSQLVRSGRATEATIERLKAELPNPITTRDSRDAQQRLQRLLDEINLAMRKGTFTGPDADTNDPAQQYLNNFRQRQSQGGASAPTK